MTKEEALEIIKTNCSSSDNKLMEACSMFIPELKESEDERIRKNCIHFLELQKAHHADTSEIDDCIAYLERQKEASYAIEVVERIDKYIDEHVANAHDMQNSNPDKKYYQGWDDALGKIAGILQDVYSNEKQKEQKPVISDEAIRDGVTHFGITQYQIDNWLKKHINVIEQQHTEWSEEDEETLACAISVFEDFAECKNVSVPPASAKRYLKRLKSLRPQQKREVVDRNVFDRIADILRWCDLPIRCPVETFKESESEREHLVEIVQCVAHRYANSCMYCKEYSRGYQDGLAVHHWKPSEEQMGRLRDAARDSTKFYDNPNDSPLMQLYNNLKSL